jgi:hypothetical protein
MNRAAMIVGKQRPDIIDHRQAGSEDEDGGAVVGLR